MRRLKGFDKHSYTLFVLLTVMSNTQQIKSKSINVIQNCFDILQHRLFRNVRKVLCNQIFMNLMPMCLVPKKVTNIERKTHIGIPHMIEIQMTRISLFSLLKNFVSMLKWSNKKNLETYCFSLQHFQNIFSYTLKVFGFFCVQLLIIIGFN